MTVLQLCYRPCVTRGANRGPERLGDLPRVTERGNGRGGMQTAATCTETRALLSPPDVQPPSEPHRPHPENDDGRPCGILTRSTKETAVILDTGLF